MIKIAFLIDQLNIGGTERQLVELANRLDKTKFSPVVVLLCSIQNSLEDQLMCSKLNLGIKHVKSFDFLKKLRNYIFF